MKPFCLLPLLALAACGAHDPEPPDAGTPEPEFIAVTRDLANYRSWPVVVIPAGETGQGERRVYLNHAPPHGSTSFPLGTILVKESLTFGAFGATSLAVDAMVKRGGGFNAVALPDAGNDGGTAAGWEWFGLTSPFDDGGFGPDGASIVWHGTFPPANAGYGPTNADCNGCHHGAEANDSVLVTDDDAGYWASGALLLRNY